MEKNAFFASNVFILEIQRKCALCVPKSNSMLLTKLQTRDTELDDAVEILAPFSTNDNESFCLYVMFNASKH
jgi:hypothetical protein